MHDHSKPQIVATVVIPVYNVAPHHIAECLSSVANQSLPKNAYEVLVIDDKSTNADTLAELADLLENWQPRFQNLSLIRNKQNLGLVGVRNKGAKIARGRFLVFLDADDAISADYLQNTIASINGNCKIGWVYSSALKFGAISSFDPAPDFRISTQVKTNPSICSSLIRRDAWLSVDGQDSRDVCQGIRWFEDWAFWLKLLSRGFYGQANRSCIFYYRQSIKSMMTRSPELMLASRYLTIRYGILRIPLMVRGKINIVRSRSGAFQYNYFGDLFFGYLTKKIAGVFDINLPSGARLRLRDIYAMIFRPSLFVKKLTSGKFGPNPCEMSIGLTMPLDINNRAFADVYH
jgi:glycosyltransferase involved in cell wall biosynthesis